MNPSPASPRPDEMERFSPRLLPVEELRDLSRLSPARSLGHILLDWTLILAAGWAAWQIHHPAAYVLAIAFIGGRQHGLLIMMHEAAHHRLFENRRLNDWVGELITWPFPFIRMCQYRRHHIPHHRHLNTMTDPDWVRKQNADWEFPRSWFGMLSLVVQDLVGIGAIKYFAGRKKVEALALPQPLNNDPDERLMVLGRALFLLLALAAITITHLWLPVLLFWLIPLFTWLQLANRLRGIAEHFAIEGREEVYAETRTTLPSLFDRIFLAPKNIGHHFEHHLYPSVPSFRLRELHRRLMAIPEFRARIHLTQGYWGVVRECVAAGRTGGVAT